MTTVLDTERPTSTMTTTQRSKAWVLPVLGILLGCAVLVSAARGQVAIPLEQVLGSVAHKLGIGLGPVPDQIGESTLWDVRFPRVALAVVVGACLAVAGALMQGIFGNPLAEPAVIGVSSGAAVGAFSVIALGLTGFGSWTSALAAFVGGMLTSGVVYLMSRSDGRTEVVTLILTGIAINAFTGAAIGLLTFLADDDARTAMAFWNLGSLNRATWSAVGIIAPCLVVGLTVAVVKARELDLLGLGERSARHVGVRVERLRLILIAISALLTAVAVAFCGVVAFVGLVVPHAVRLLAGPGHRLLIPASALGGALVLVLGDLVARNAIAYQEIPLGSLTALVGGPVFFVLVRRSRARAGGWA